MGKGEWEVQVFSTESISHGDERYSGGNVVRSTVIAPYGGRWELHLWGAQRNARTC